eukprot:TRINITY_DN4902_c0_g1_i1.p1 TRINITY_DN4902_c0_g1~~TRINITY_DN4902_c0_g1_i1.p1  ORF type:complete len:552 (-),score=55.30 TRINITY_DN4902_c0_g1_i1:119-1603(-)
MPRASTTQHLGRCRVVVLWHTAALLWMVVAVVWVGAFAHSGTQLSPYEVAGHTGKAGGNDSIVLNTTVLWSGGVAANCACDGDNCTCDSNTRYSPNFACNAERYPFFNNRPGNWNNGSNSFFVPVPHTYTVIRVTATLHGRFACSIPLGDYSPDTIFNVLVGSIILHTGAFNVPACSFCSYCNLCDACETELVAVSLNFTGGYPGWSYDEEMSVQVTVEQGVVCLSSIDIEVLAVLQEIPILTTSTGDGDGDGSEVALPLWGIILLSAGGFVCIVVVCGVIGLALLNTWDRGRGRGMGRRTPVLGAVLSTLFGDESASQLLVDKRHFTRGSSTQDRVQVRVRNHGAMSKQMAYEEMLLGKRIGKGSYGEVYLGTWRGTEVAIKKLPYYFADMEDNEQQKQFVESFILETELMTHLRHPNVICLYAAFTDPELCMVMEYMPRGSLYSILHNKSIDLTWELLKQIMIDSAKGMTYLHNSRPIIVHRDLVRLPRAIH